MKKVRPRKVKIILPSALCCSGPFKWATASRRNYRGDSRRLSAHGVRRGFSGEQRGSQGVLFPESGKWAEAKADPAAGDLALGPQSINELRWGRGKGQRWKDLCTKGYVWNGYLLVSSDLLQCD